MKFLVSVLFLIALAPPPCSADEVHRTIRSTLDTGSLAGTRILVAFSYDDRTVAAVGDSYSTLDSFDFTLFGVAFTRAGIFEGGQAIFRDGVLQNVTASFQEFLPAGSLVRNVTFGFGGPGVIGYVDLNHHFGRGSFTFGPAVMHPGIVDDVRHVDNSNGVAGRGIEIELSSDDPFPVRDQIMILQIGGQQFSLSRYAHGDLHSVVFTLTEDEFESIGCSQPMIVQYGVEPADEIWDFGDLNKKILR